MEEQELKEMFSSLLDEKLQPLKERLESLEEEQRRISEKLKHVSEQVAANTEDQTKY